MTDAPPIRVLYEEDAIAGRITDLAAGIAAEQPKNLLVVAILKGSFVFAADLVR